MSLLVMGHGAFAEDTPTYFGPSMQFAFVRSNAPGCEPTCPEWISAEGAIQADTPALFRRVLKILNGRKLPIVVNSPGGDVNAALTLGRLIRKNKLDIAVGKTQCDRSVSSCTTYSEGVIIHYLGDSFAAGAMCNSACPLMFAGGVRRLVGEQAFLGVHQITTTYVRTRRQYRTTYRVVHGKKYMITTETITQDNAGGYKTYKMSKSLEKKLAGYFSEMGVEKSVLATMKNTPASAIHQLELQNMLRAKLVTSLDSLDLVTGAGICQATPLPENCNKIPAPADKLARSSGAADPAGSSGAAESHLEMAVCADGKGGTRIVATNPSLGEACGGPGGTPWPALRSGMPSSPHAPPETKP
ncbi:MAG: hypothetical protein E5W02_03390 [Mesorhizobium sp.]|nr:MAG: hypothetical protein E5W02_03390 [Mesorhizobium sp.]